MQGIMGKRYSGPLNESTSHSIQEQQDADVTLSADLSVRTIPDGFGAGCTLGSLFADIHQNTSKRIYQGHQRNNWTISSNYMQLSKYRKWYFLLQDTMTKSDHLQPHWTIWEEAIPIS